MEKEVIEVSESETTEETQSADILKLISETLTEQKSSGFALVVADSEGRTRPLVGARNLGELLVMQKVLEKEINRLADSILSSEQK
jgi:hypothetical protein